MKIRNHSLSPGLSLAIAVFASCQSATPSAQTGPADVMLTVVASPKGSIQSDDGSISCGSTCNTSKPYGSIINLTATPTDPGWRFAQWIQGAPGLITPTCQLSLLDATTAEALFVPNDPTCTDQAKNGNETDVDCGGSCSGCALGKACQTIADCVAGIQCSAGRCTETTPPTISSGQLMATSLGTTILGLSWSAASDNFTTQQNLKYSLYVSAANPAYASFGTVAQVESGTLVTSGANVKSAIINSGLTAGNSYYFNVVVADQAGNKSVYSPYGELFQANLSVFYPFNNSDSDITASGNNAVATNAPTFTADRFGFAASTRTFTEGSSQKLQSTSDFTLGTGSRTLTFWHKAAATPGTIVLGLGSLDGVPGSTFGVYHYNGMNLWCFAACDLITGQPTTTNWEHWALVYDSTTSMLTAYKNGVAVLGPTLPAGGTTINTLTGPLTIGTGVTTGNSGQYFYGSVDEIRVYTRVLTPAEIARMYTVSRP